METDPIRMCALLVGLGDVVVVGVDDVAGGPLRVLIEIAVPGTTCPGCGRLAWVKDRHDVEHVDMPCFGRPTRLVWRKHRMCCSARCGQSTWTITDDRIAGPRAVMTTRAGKWATVQVGRHGRTVAEVADELGSDWHTVNDTVIAYGEALLDDDDERLGAPTAIGMDEVLMVRVGQQRRQQFVTSIVDVRAGKLLDVVEGRESARPDRVAPEPPGGVVFADRSRHARPRRLLPQGVRHRGSARGAGRGSVPCGSGREPGRR